MGLFKYIKTAFLAPWNLLAFGAGMAAATLSFDANLAMVIASLVAAGEIAYLGFLGTHPRFQKYVEAQEAKGKRSEATVGAQQALQQILTDLPAPARQRFEALRTRCLELRQIAVNLRDPSLAHTPLPLDEFQLEGLDRLLWIYLRLLFTQHALERFLIKTSEKELRQNIQTQESRLQALPADSGDPQRQRVRKSLEDNLETSRARLQNLQKARDHMELVKLEIERLETKIYSLSELAVNRQEPNFISEQVDQVATSMAQTERTMNELQFATGLSTAQEEVPQLIRRQTVSET
jgi:chemotaxis protein histidine kinase CheA